MFMIHSKDISIIVQGPITSSSTFDLNQGGTKEVLSNIRNIFPDSEIILSTWEGSDIDFLSFDRVIFNKDPGATVYSVNNNNYNVNRQIVSTLSGLKLASRPYAIKTRTDVTFSNKNFIKYFYKFTKRSKDFAFLENRVIVSNYTTVNPKRILPFPFHICDWLYFGLTSDLISIWNIKLCTEDEARWFEEHLKPLNHPFESFLSRYQAEQFIWYSFVRKYITINLDNCCDLSEYNLAVSEHIIANNIIILSCRQLGINSFKYPDINHSHAHLYQMYSYVEWIHLYNRYCKDCIFSMFDFDLLICESYFFDGFLSKAHQESSTSTFNLIRFLWRELKTYLKRNLISFGSSRLGR